MNKCGACVRAYVTEYGRKNPLRKVWQHMMERCYKETGRFFHRYGGRGVLVCDRWHVFENFRSDMEQSYRPGLTLDRKNNDGNYEPGNCRWATQKEQTQNSTVVRMVEINGEKLTVTEWAKRTGLSVSVMWHRLFRLKWDPVRAISQPLMRNQYAVR